MYENTVIVIVGDHGEAFGDLTRSAATASFAEESLRVPLIIPQSASLQDAKTVAGRLSLVDVLPGLLELFKAPAPAAVRAGASGPSWTAKKKGGGNLFRACSAGKSSTGRP